MNMKGMNSSGMSPKTMMQGSDVQETNNLNSANMMMVFNTNNFETMLYSAQWMITGPSSYAGSWLFLFFLAIIWRALHFGLRRYDEATQRKLQEENMRSEMSSSSEAAVEKRKSIIQRPLSLVHKPLGQHWKPSVQIPRAIATTVIQGVAYLLMIAVMTMNVGFFFAVVTGFFIGEIFFGQFSHEFNAGP